jgi:4-hydroxybenzoate polyprenyltransferase
MLSPMAAWIAIRGELDWPPVVLAAVIFFWVGGFDILYACQDVDFDQGAGLHSIPARWGIPRALKIAAFSHACAAVCLLALWSVSGLGPVFLVGTLLIAGLLIYEHWLVRPDDLTRVNIAFFQVNAVISVGLFLIGVADVLVAG